ncbi:hypothetical protein ZWY2020_011476 [Hordeum vulgare]|nr:hypothetical protein ZWY2020_011476 [Hordeum vulgare]
MGRPEPRSLITSRAPMRRRSPCVDMHRHGLPLGREMRTSSSFLPRVEWPAPVTSRPSRGPSSLPSQSSARPSHRSSRPSQPPPAGMPEGMTLSRPMAIR